MPMSNSWKSSRQTLMIDADDTLWENNIYFERAIANFISFLNHRHFSAAQVRQKLNEVEHESIVKLGYGLHSFAAALVATFERLSVEPLTPALHETIHGIAAAIAEQPIELLKHVSPTLDALRSRHRLLLVTKGDVAEQTGKVEPWKWWPRRTRRAITLSSANMHWSRAQRGWSATAPSRTSIRPSPRD
jgi:putative hydrolase of the HAD superfamily